MAENYRGSSSTPAPKCVVVSKEEYLRLTAQAPTPTRKLEDEEIVFKTLGLIPESYSYTRCMKAGDLKFTEAAYLPSKKLVLIPDWKEVSLRTLVHESIHALQDEAGRLNELNLLARNSSDLQLALTAVIEGEAMVAERDLKAQLDEPVNPQSTPEVNDSCALPESLNKMFDFPYDYGQFFVQYVTDSGGRALLNQVLKSPPKTTEEILYPRKFLAHDISLNAKNISRADKHARFKDSLGEFFIRTLLKSWIQPQRAILAAKGWNGDTVVLFNHSQGRSVHWRIHWDSEADAKEFWEAALEMFSKRYGVPLRSESNNIEMQPISNVHVRFVKTAISTELSLEEGK